MTAGVFLTGGTGMAGHNFMDLAAERGVDVVAPTHAQLDLLDAVAVREALRKCQPSIVVHAAGLVGGIQANMREPIRFLVNNFEMGRNVVLAAREAGIERLINLGSSCMYPKDSPHPLKETDILSGQLEPTNEAYAIAKIAVQRLAAYVSATEPRFQYKTLIPCNLFGRYDSFSETQSHLAAAAIHKLHRAKIEGRTSVEIWGDGSARREFMYAADLADAILVAIERFETLPAIMNVGPGQDRSVDEYYRTAGAVVGFTGTFSHDLGRPVGMKQKLMDVSLAAAWGWHVKTSLEQGLAETYAYYEKQVATG